MYVSVHVAYGFQKEVESESGEKHYVVSWGTKVSVPDKLTYRQLCNIYNNTHFWTCTCPDWIHRRSKLGEHCKHIESVMQSNDLCTWYGSIGDTQAIKGILCVPDRDDVPVVHLSFADVPSSYFEATTDVGEEKEHEDDSVPEYGLNRKNLK